ncbi:MAG: cyclic nucleotide-binding domain-containing protein [Gammaproteobacteria bacterium]|nr:cyclic nucleotide-binding domain-containing protein [Gammaproteobacteria bacterium]
MNPQASGAAPSLRQRCSRCGVDYPVAVLVFLAAVSLVAAFGLPRLALDSSAARLIPQDATRDPFARRAASEFGSAERSFVYLSDPQLWTPGKLQALATLHADLRQLPFVARIDDLFTQSTVKRIAGELSAQPLLQALPTDAAGAARARLAALEDPRAVGHLISAQGNALAIVLALRPSGEDTSPTAIAAAVEQVLSGARGEFATLVAVGPPQLAAAIQAGLAHDLRVLVPVGAGLIVLLGWVLYRSVLAAVAPLLVAGLSLWWTFGALGWARIPLGVLGALLPALVAVTAVTAALRLVAGYYGGLHEAHQRGVPPTRLQATDFMLRGHGAPALLAVFAAALCWASGSLAGLPLLRDFSLAASFALLMNALITTLLLPLLYAAWGPHTARGAADALATRVGALAVRGFASLHARRVRVALAVVALGCAVLLQQAAPWRVSTDPMGFLRPEQALVQASQRLERDLAGVNSVDLTLESNTEGAFRDPANLQRLMDIQAFISKQKIFDRTLSLADVVAQANQEAGGGRPEFYRVPGSRKLVAEYLLLQPARDLEPYVSYDYRRANIVVRYAVRDARVLNHHLRELKRAAEHYAGADLSVTLGGENLLINAAATDLLKGQGWALLGLLALVFGVISLLFTSLKGGFIAWVPCVLPLVVICGAMKVLEIPLNVGSALLLMLAISFALDSTMQLFASYSERCRSTASYEEAVVETVRQMAVPVVGAGLVMALGFSVLLLSDFVPVRQFGGLAAATLLLSVLANLFVTPLIMSRLRLVGLYEMLALSQQRAALEHCALFKGMSDYQIRKAILISELLDYPAGECLIVQGTVGRSMFLVVSGRLEVARVGPGNYRLLATLGPGDLFGEVGFVQATHRTAEVRAVGPVSVLRFDHARLEADLLFFPHLMAKLNFNISGILGRRLAEVVEAQAQHAPAAPPGAQD